MWSALVVTAFAADPVAPADGSPEDMGKPAFSAGSYGRVQASTDLAGGGGDAVNVASHAPRTEQGNYLELDLSWRAELADGTSFEVVITPALAGDLFHYDGTFGDALSLRNLYGEADRLGGKPVAVWAGSRMYRGDDTYLLDFWPLDSLNTYGGGVRWHPDKTEVAVHVGVNRLVGEDWQVQDAVVAVPDRVDGQAVTVLDRQRTIGTVRASRQIPVGDDLVLRFKAYGEVHTLPAGTRRIDDPFEAPMTEELPADRGSTMGLQASLWGWAPQSFVHVWVRRSTGLAATGELTIPTDGFAVDHTVAAARLTRVAIAGNTETSHVGVMASGYVSAFSDADGNTSDVDDRTEIVGVIRPNLYVGEHVNLALEASRQDVLPRGNNPWTGTWDKPTVTKLSVLPGVQVSKGGYARPRLQVQYTATLLDEDARDWFAPDDARVGAGPVQHFVGVGAEWWVNSKRPVLPQ